jgi:hypothetical protein
MTFHKYWLVLPAFLGLIAAAEDDAPWRNKQIPEWSEDDARQVLSDSPWAKSFTPTIKTSQEGHRSGGMGRGGGIGIGGIGIGIPGMGGMGGRHGGYGGNGGNGAGGGNAPIEAPKLTLRWESAMPVRTAELKAHEKDEPTLDEGQYAIAVYGVPSRMLNGELDKLGDQFKKQAALKRDGKKDLKPSRVQVVDGAAGPVITYFFPMTAEITKQDRRVEFDATISRLELTQSFFPEDMLWQGKLEL